MSKLKKINSGTFNQLNHKIPAKRTTQISAWVFPACRGLPMELGLLPAESDSESNCWLVVT